VKNQLGDASMCLKNRWLIKIQNMSARTFIDEVYNCFKFVIFTHFIHLKYIHTCLSLLELWFLTKTTELLFLEHENTIETTSHKIVE